MRELYGRNVQGRLQGIDTGFGVSLHAIPSQDEVLSGVAFADVALGQDQEADGDVFELEGGH